MIRGAKLGPYEILGPLGAGGMGEVYKARDTRLDRTVAIKVLSSRLAADPDLRQRLESEARAVSSLNHPHICTLYDIGRQDDVDFLVLEYLEGESLAERLTKGALPLETALRYAIEIAGALDQAHRHGIVHRDLKPGNVMLTKAGTKLLDFGLAKFRGARVGQADETALLTQKLTSEGTIVGTLQYMSPEQLEGREADMRSDIFAFGAVLYEMISGRAAFQGASQATLISSIIVSDPPALANAKVSRVVKACLAKDPDDRWQSARDLRRELQWLVEPANEAAAESPRRSRLPYIAFGLSMLGLAFSVWLQFRVPTPDQRPLRFTIPTEAKLPSQVRMSPDGSRVAFVGQNAEGKFVLWIRVLDQPDSHSLPGTEGAQFPFWAPDNRRIAFFDHGQSRLKVVDSFSGSPQTLAEGVFGRGGDWSRDGTIIFSGDERDGVHRVSSTGGVAIPIASTVRQGKSTIPLFFADGKHFIYENRLPNFRTDNGSHGLMLASLDSSDAKLLTATPYSGALSIGSPSYLLFVADGALMAQPMDSSYYLRGEAARILDSLSTDGNHSTADVSVSQNGTLAFNAAVYQHELIWVDRSGNRQGKGVPVDRYSHPRMFPDQTQVIFERMDPKTSASALWKLDVARGTTSLFENEGSLPVIFPDGKNIAFTCRDNGKPHFCIKAAGGARPREIWKDVPSAAMVDISPDQKFLAYTNLLKDQFWILPLTDGKEASRFYPVESAQFHGTFSPDGKWVAYSGNETGEFEVYVQPFPATGDKWKVSSNGGSQPHWRRDGKEMFYRREDGSMMAVPLKSGTRFEAGAPHLLFAASAEPLFPNLSNSYDVTADGQRFIINVLRDERDSPPITIITNWRSLLKR